MKKSILFMSAVAMLAAASCNKPELENIDKAPEVGKNEFVAYVESPTKTQLNDLVTEWVANDKIDIKGVAYITDNGGARAIFSKCSEEDENPVPPYYAAYPYSCVNYYDDSNCYTINVLNEFSLEANHIGDYVPAVAYSESEASLYFQNVASLFKFQVPTIDEPITEIRISATEVLAGEVVIDQKGEVPTWITESGFDTYTELILTTDEAFDPTATYYVPVLPGKKTNLTVKLNGTVVATGISMEFKRNVIHNVEILPSTEVRTVYLKPGVWAADNAWFSAHFFGAADVDTKMVDSDEDGIYEVAVPNGATGVIFCRMNPTHTEFSWDEGHVWNQSADLTVPGKDDDKLCYEIKGWDVEGVWITYDDATFVPEVDASDFGLVGSFQSPTTWDVDNPVAMEYVADDWIVAKNVELYKTDEFKFVQGKSWDNPSYGTSAATALENNVETTVVTSYSQNMKVSKNGKYDIYLNPNALKVKAVCIEEYSDLTVDITIDNKANWSPLTITLWDGETKIVDNQSVTGNKYTISGEYIGSSLTCQLSSGSKTSETLSVAVTKNGATVTLEETIVKLKIQLDTSNSKQWWGNTMKIHVWNTGTSFDTSWPGTTMTSEGNYTWSIIVPSELVGKTINFLVHNGNGWQSKDSQVKISAEGTTVTGSSIGVN